MKFALEVRWFADAACTQAVRTDTFYPSLTEEYQTFAYPSETTYLDAAGPYMLPGFYFRNPDNIAPAASPGICIDDFTVVATNMIDDSGYHYEGAMDTRPTAVLHTDGGWLRYGDWTIGEADIYSSGEGDQLSFIFTGSYLTVAFSASTDDAVCDVLVDGIVRQADLDVSAAIAVTVESLATDIEHVLRVVVKGGTVRVAGATLDPVRRITVDWTDMNFAQCLESLQSTIGGEYYPDIQTKTIWHDAQQGRNLRTQNIIELRRGKNLISCPITYQTDSIVNRYICLGYGEGATRLRVIVDADSVNDDGDTSQDVYDILTDVYENKECYDPVVLRLEGLKKANENCWPKVEYAPMVPEYDARGNPVAGMISTGDTIRIYWDEDPSNVIDEDVRVLEVRRTNDGSPATLIVGDMRETFIRMFARGAG